MIPTLQWPAEENGLQIYIYSNLMVESYLVPQRRIHVGLPTVAETTKPLESH